MPLLPLFTRAASQTRQTALFAGASQDASIAGYTALPSAESGVGLVDLPVNAEDDDALHRPTEDGEDRDRCLDMCTPFALLNVGGLMLMTIVVVGIFVGLPIVSFFQRAAQEVAGSA